MKYEPQKNMPEFSLVIIPLLCCLIAAGAFLSVGNRLLISQQKEKKDYQSQIQQTMSNAKSSKEQLAAYENKLRNLQQAIEFCRNRIENARRTLDKTHDEKKRVQALKGELAELNRKRAELEEQARQIDSLHREVLELKRSRKEIKSDTDKAKKEIERIQTLLASAQQEKQQQAKVFNVGTLRGGKGKSTSSALYVECINGGIMLQPKGIHLSHNLSAEEQAKFLSTANHTGHVVFLIRPDGFKSFRRYRSIIVSHNKISRQRIDLGYEPVNADWALIYPSAKELAYAQGK